MSFSHKVREIFGDLAVDKSLTLRHEVGRLPRFISEYLLSLYSGKESGFEKLSQAIREFYPESKDKDKVLHKIKQNLKIRLIDEFKVSVDVKKDLYKLEIPSLQINDALADERVVRNCEGLLSGIWGLGTLTYFPEILVSSPEGEGKKAPTPIALTSLEPFQVYNVDLSEFAEKRKKFTKQEWIDLLITSIGLNPEVYAQEQKQLLLLRLVPLVENNVNLLELGPRATGKTYLYRNASYYTRIYAGGLVSPARLFFDARIKVVGDIGTRDAVIFDEIARIEFGNPAEMIGKLKDFMVDGFFERGSLKRAHSVCSLVFLGNLDEPPTAQAVINALPAFMKDIAFLDRIHGLIPGWKLPKIMKSEVHLAKGYGLAADYFAQIMHELRQVNLQERLRKRVKLGEDFTIRDERAIFRLAEGMLKIMHPDGEAGAREIEEAIDLATKSRQGVADLLCELAPAEFPPKRLKYEVLE